MVVDTHSAMMSDVEGVSECEATVTKFTRHQIEITSRKILVGRFLLYPFTPQDESFGFEGPLVRRGFK